MVAFQQRRDLGVLGRDLGFEKDVLAFELRQVAIVSRGRPRLVEAGRWVFWRQVFAVLSCDRCRGQPRLVVADRGSKLSNLRDVPRD